MFDPHPQKALLTAREVAVLLSMGAATFKRFRSETPSFPRPIKLGQSERSDRDRWRKAEVLAWIMCQPAIDAADSSEQLPTTADSSQRPGKQR